MAGGRVGGGVDGRREAVGVRKFSVKARRIRIHFCVFFCFHLEVISTIDLMVDLWLNEC